MFVHNTIEIRTRTRLLTRLHEYILVQGVLVVITELIRTATIRLTKKTVVDRLRNVRSTRAMLKGFLRVSILLRMHVGRSVLFVQKCTVYSCSPVRPVADGGRFEREAIALLRTCATSANVSFVAGTADHVAFPCCRRNSVPLLNRRRPRRSVALYPKPNERK